MRCTICRLLRTPCERVLPHACAGEERLAFIHDLICQWAENDHLKTVMDVGCGEGKLLGSMSSVADLDREKSVEAVRSGLGNDPSISQLHAPPTARLASASRNDNSPLFSRLVGVDSIRFEQVLRRAAQKINRSASEAPHRGEGIQVQLFRGSLQDVAHTPCCDVSC